MSSLVSEVKGLTSRSCALSFCRAVDACPGEEGETLGQRSDALLEWLCLHLEEDELPQGFDPRGRNLDVIRPGQDFGAGTTANSRGGGGRVANAAPGEKGGGSVADGDDRESAADSVEGNLLRYGFGHAEVAEAIANAAAAALVGPGGASEEKHRDDKSDASLLRPLEILAEGLATTSIRKHGAGRATGLDAEVQTEEEGREAVDEEAMSLEAIYDGAVTVAQNMPEVTFLSSRGWCALLLVGSRSAYTHFRDRRPFPRSKSKARVDLRICCLVSDLRARSSRPLEIVGEQYSCVSADL